MPQVSVIMPCYNAVDCLDRAVRSVQAQTLQDWELIAVDDCSSDGSLNRLKELAAVDQRIRVLQTPVNGGPSVARNLGIRESTGFWIAILDSDDAFKPGRLAYLTTLATARQADLIFDGLIYYDDQRGCETGRSFAEDKTMSVTFEDLIQAEAPNSPLKLGFLKPLIRREFLTKFTLKYSETLRFAEDFDLYARCLLSGAKAVLDQRAFYVYTTQLGQISGVRSQGTRTKFTPATRVEIMDNLIADYGSSIDESAAAALRQGRRWQILYSDAHRLGELRRTKQWAAFMQGAIRNPRALWRFVSRSRLFRSAGGGSRSAAGI